MEYRFINDELIDKVYRYTFSYPKEGKDLPQLIFQLELIIDKERTTGDINSLNIIRLRVSTFNEFSIVLLGKNKGILDLIEKFGAVLTYEKEFNLGVDHLGYVISKEEDNLYYFGVCSEEFLTELEKRREALERRREFDKEWNEKRIQREESRKNL